MNKIDTFQEFTDVDGTKCLLLMSKSERDNLIAEKARAKAEASYRRIEGFLFYKNFLIKEAKTQQTGSHQQFYGTAPDEVANEEVLEFDCTTLDDSTGFLFIIFNFTRFVLSFQKPTIPRPRFMCLQRMWARIQEHGST